MFHFPFSDNTLSFLFTELDVNNDPPSVETKTAPYGKTVELQCKTDLEPPVSYQWKKQSGLLPKDAYTREVRIVFIIYFVNI